MHPPPIEGRVLVCDLDGTLVRANTFPLFVKMATWALVKEGRLHPLAMLGIAMIRRKLGRGSHVALKASVDKIAAQLSEDVVRKWAEQLLARYLNHDVCRMVAEWEGAAVLATAAPETYARVIGKLAGFDVVQGSRYIGSRYIENVHRTKVDTLASVIDGHGICTAITDDSVLDGPLLGLAEEGYVVEPSGRVLRYRLPE